MSKDLTTKLINQTNIIRKSDYKICWKCFRGYHFEHNVVDMQDKTEFENMLNESKSKEKYIEKSLKNLDIENKQ